jgi:chaperonin GroEL (HSP60 family)
VQRLKKASFPVAGSRSCASGSAVEGPRARRRRAIGAEIVSRPSTTPLRQLCKNAGIEGSLIVQHVINSKGNMGYNVATESTKTSSRQVLSIRPR